jgi:hypothetical protein
MNTSRRRHQWKVCVCVTWLYSVRLCHKGPANVVQMYALFFSKILIFNFRCEWRVCLNNLQLKFQRTLYQVQIALICFNLLQNEKRVINGSGAHLWIKLLTGSI